jgi:hypothetical protein
MLAPLLALAAVLLAAATVATRTGWLLRRRRRSVTVHTRDEQTIEGILAMSAPDGIVLRAARYLDTTSTIPLAGEVFIPRDRVAFIQVQSRGEE